MEDNMVSVLAYRVKCREHGQLPSLNRKQLCYHIYGDPSAPGVFYEWFENT